jgi:hypothetical protein
VSTGKYSARPWRARFLRSPKVALEFASRSDFTSLAALSELKLGLKTGSDDFFYVVPAPRPPKNENPAFPGMDLRGTLHVRGLNEWEGELPKRDLLPAIRNPHELLDKDGTRPFLIPSKPIAYYVYPRDQKPHSQLDEYILMAEQVGVSRRKLVQDNASNHWYRQARGLVRSRWALPYNSAYDYGAWDNQAGAVLNGRFVGVDAIGGVDDELLGAVLNSTFAMAGRLLEGVTTGVEGALDVGPPAARRIMVPNLHAFTAQGSALVKEVMTAIRAEGRMPPGPAAKEEVDRLRAKLDSSLLVALGMTGGQAAALLDRLYESYRRWRASVEDVERQMRSNRSQMNRAGQNRASRKSPEETAADEIWDVLQADYPRLPFDLLLEEEGVETIEIPRTVNVQLERPLFDETKVALPNGAMLELSSWERVRYLSLLKEIGFHSPFSLPKDATRAGAIVDQFAEALLRVRDASGTMSTSRVTKDKRDKVIQLVIERWLKSCREAGMIPPKRAQEAEREPVLKAPS